MRCPNCHDEYEDGVHACAECGVPLVSATAAVDAPTPVRPQAALGTFHPAVAERITVLLYRRGIAYTTMLSDDGVRIVVDREWRDDLRAELAVTWGELVRRLPEEQAVEVMAAGGSNPGWVDPPHGGYVDREGRLVVDVDDGEDAENDAARVLGPTLLTLGAVLGVTGWYLFSSTIMVVAGVALVVIGLLLPR